MVGSPQAIMCTVSTVDGVEPSAVIISWIGPEGSHVNTSRVTIVMKGMKAQIDENPLYPNTYNSTLKFTYLMEGDEGVYMCSVRILDTVNLQTAEIESLTSEQTVYI